MIMGENSDIGQYQPQYVKLSANRRKDPNLPRELQYHELEESREYRESRQGNYPDMMRDRPFQVKSKNPA